MRVQSNFLSQTIEDEMPRSEIIDHANARRMGRKIC